MKEKLISKPTPKADVPYDVANAADVTAFWENALSRRSIEELRATRGRAPEDGTNRTNKSRGGLIPMCSPSMGVVARG